jgi:hypothetical protein
LYNAIPVIERDKEGRPKRVPEKEKNFKASGSTIDEIELTDQGDIQGGNVVKLLMDDETAVSSSYQL